MTAGQDGTPGNPGTPESDDPFGYLYRSEDGTQQPAAPRNSYNQVQRVGERRSPQQGQKQGGYGYPQQQGQQGGYGYPQQQPQQQGGYGYPHQQPYQGQQQTAYSQRQPQHAPGGPDDGGHRGSGGGTDGNRKGLLIGAIAVVVAVAIGIAFAMTNDSGKDNQANDKPTTSTSASTGTSAPTTEPTPTASPAQFASDKVDAATLTLAGGAAQSQQWTGANAANGTYVDHMGQPGASATWTVEVPEDGDYTFFVDYGNAGEDSTLSLAVNGKLRTTPVNFKNYGSSTKWDEAWNNTTFAYVSLAKGSNTLQLVRQQSDAGNGVNLDQVWLKQGKVKE